MPSVQIIYSVDTMSSWCLIAEDAIEQLRSEFGDRIEFQWKLAQLDNGAPFKETPEKFAWFYARTNAVTGVQLNPAWHTSMDDSSLFPNLAAEGARALGVTDDRVRRALSRAAMIDGKAVPKREVALAIAAEAGGLDRARLAAAMDDHTTLSRIVTSTIEFRELPVGVIPTFVISNDVGDRAILSGQYEYATLGAVVREMLQASTRYAEFMAKNPDPAP